MNRFPLLAALCAITAACSPGAPGALQTVVTDSAGVAIVTAQSLDRLPARSLTGPLLDLPTSQDSSDASFSRVGAVLRLSDGRVIVADGASRRLKVFASDGTYLRTLGGPEGDATELMAITAIWPAGRNRIVAFDRRQRSLFTLNLDGGPVEFAEIAIPPGNPRAVGRLASGHVLVRSLLIDVPETGFDLTDIAITRYHADGSLADTVGIWPSARMGRLGQPPVQLVSSPMFEPRVVGAAAGDRLLVTDCRTPEYRVIDPQRGLESVVRWPATQDSVTEDDVRSFRARRLDPLGPEQQGQVRAFLDDMPINTTMPACDQLRIDSDGRAWVRTYLRPAAPLQRWLVFDSSGGPVFSVDLPAESRIMDINSDYVTVIERRPLDVPRVRVYGIE
ncbi:MAG: hypothetical protein ACE5FP_06870 [Gemmatimonadota bacterium]